MALCCALLPLDSAERVLATAYASHPFDVRLNMGRRAQLGESMVYRPGLIGGDGVETDLTYGEYNLEFYGAL
eukprot:5828439-Prymnesium_polylepis.1